MCNCTIETKFDDAKFSSDGELVTRNVEHIADLLPKLSQADQFRFFLLLGIRLDHSNNRNISTKQIGFMYGNRVEGYEWSKILEHYNETFETDLIPNFKNL